MGIEAEKHTTDAEDENKKAEEARRKVEEAKFGSQLCLPRISVCLASSSHLCICICISISSLFFSSPPGWKLVIQSMDYYTHLCPLQQPLGDTMQLSHDRMHQCI